MADQAELAFVKNFVNILAAAPVHYPADYQQPPHNSLRRVPVLPIDLPKPPERAQPQASTSTFLTVTFKSIKPPTTYSLPVSPTDSIASIKSQLVAAHPTAPPADAQRLLLKGKALADNKLLREYSVKDGDTINLLVKPGFTWDPSKPKPPPIAEKENMNINTDAARRAAHSRVPSVVLSPSPSGQFPGEEKPVDILLTLDTSTIPTPSLSPEASSSTYNDTIINPEFWQRLLTFLRSEFQTYDDAAQAWEDFLRVSKGTLTPGQIAKIRDHVGVVGMAGT